LAAGVQTLVWQRSPNVRKKSKRKEGVQT